MVGKKQTAIFMVFLAILALLPGCARKQQVAQQPKKLVSLWSGTENTVTENGVSVKAKKFTEKDFDAVFDGRGKKMLVKSKKGKAAMRGIQPIQLSVKNESTNPWMLTQNSIGLETVKDSKKIAPYFKQYKHIARGLKICALMTLVLLVPCGIFFLTFYPTLAVILPVVAGVTVVSVSLVTTPVVGIYQFTKDNATNEKFMETVQQNQLKNSIILEPGQSIDALIFVKKKDVKEQFDITLFDAENVQNELVLKVDLSKNLNS